MSEANGDSAQGLGHVEGRGWDGQGRSMMEKVTCSCGWEIRSDQAYFAEWRRKRWMEHAVHALLHEVADLHSQLEQMGSSTQEGYA